MVVVVVVSWVVCVFERRARDQHQRLTDNKRKQHKSIAPIEPFTFTSHSARSCADSPSFPPPHIPPIPYLNSLSR